MSKKKMFFSGVAILLVVTVIIAVIFFIRKNGEKNIYDIVGEEMTLKESLKYWTDEEKVKIETEFDQTYIEATNIVILNIEGETATISVSAPPIKEILISSVPDKPSGGFDEVFGMYMSSVVEKIKNLPENEKIETTYTCGVKNDNGKAQLVIDENFVKAIYPEIHSLLNKALLATF